MSKCDNRTVLLIDPPYYRLFKDTYSLPRYPLSLGYLAGAIRTNTDWNVVTYNADFLPRAEPTKVSYLAGPGFDRYLRHLHELSAPIWKEVGATIARYRPSLVGISCKSQTFASARVVAAIAKQLNPSTTVVAGGPHPSMVPAAVLESPHIDIAVRGEGEQTVVGLLNAVDTHGPFEPVPGLLFRRNGRLVETPPRAFIDNLDSLSFPHEAAPEVLHDYRLYGPDSFSHVFATRGCPYNCLFCGSRHVWSRKVRFRSARNVVQEIAALQQKGVTSVHFDDDTFGVSKRYISELCEAIINERLALQWSCELHVNLADDETVALMKQARCHSVQLGIESGNNRILRSMRKGFTIERALAAVEVIRRHGIGVEAFFMVGFPEETEETLNDTASAMRKVNGRVAYSIFTPYPGTEAFEVCREKGLVGEEYDVALYNHQSPRNCFCMYIPADRFRTIVSKIERMVDKKNYSAGIGRFVSRDGLKKAREMGLVRSVKKGLRACLAT